MAFQVKSKNVLFKLKVEAINCLGTTLCYGDSKGTVVLGQVQISDSLFNIQNAGGSKVSKKKIDRLAILSTTKQIICLSSGKLTVLDPTTINQLKVLHKDVTTFVINESDCIAIVLGKKILFYHYALDKNDFVPWSFGKVNEISLTDQIIKLGIAYH